jgi:hypothetical protein
VYWNYFSGPWLAEPRGAGVLRRAAKLRPCGLGVVGQSEGLATRATPTSNKSQPMSALHYQDIMQRLAYVVWELLCTPCKK